MKSIKVQIEDLMTSCFEIESQLKNFDNSELATNSTEQWLRNDLYAIRCKMGTLIHYADKIDKDKLNKG